MDETARLKQQRDEILGALRNSPSAASGSQPASRSDVYGQQQLLKTQENIDRVINDEKKKRWYGSEEGASQNTEAPKKGLIGHSLDFILAPSRLVAGSVDYLTGQAKGKSLTESAVGNLEAGRGFGDVLKGAGLPSIVSRPLGFALDIFTDPINMATAGTSALIPRVFYGFAKGGAKGAAVGAASNLLETGLQIRNIVKGTGKAANTAANTVAKKFGDAVRLTPEAAAKAAIPTTNIPRRIYSKWWDNVSNLGTKAEAASVKLSKQYDNITGTSALKRLNDLNKPSQWRQSLSQLVADAKDANPKFGEFLDAFTYDNAKWHREAMLKEQLIKSFGSVDETNKFISSYQKAMREGAKGEEAMAQAKAEYTAHLEAKMNANINKAKGPAEVTPPPKPNPVAESMSQATVTDELADVASEQLEDLTAAKEIAENFKPYVVTDHVENAYRMAKEAELTEAYNVSGFMEEIEAIIKRGDVGETGWKWFDSLKTRLENDKKFVVNFGKGKDGAERQASLGKAAADLLGGLETLTAFFKMGAVGGSLSAWTNAILGNPVMASMAGINIADPKYLRAVKGAASVSMGLESSKRFVAELVDNSDMLRVFQEHPELFRQTTGLDARLMVARDKMQTILNDALETGILDTATIQNDDVISGFARELADIADMVRQGAGKDNPALQTAMTALKTSVQKAPKTARQTILSSIPESGQLRSDYTTLSANELLGTKRSREILNSISEKAKESGPLSASYWLDLSLNKMAGGYEKIDQSYKFGTVAYLAKEGVTEAELRKLSRFVKIEPDMVEEIVSDGIRRYKIDGNKAMEVANEIYLNYNAMPTAVKVLRNLPLIGHPFAAFMYGMYIKTGKTFAFNPAFFNNVQFTQDAISKEQSPIEKALLSDPRYSYLKDRGMIKIGGEANQFFDKHTMYLNVANLLPYLSLNMFTPSERKYDGWGGALVSAIDKSPILKDPIGQTMFDYFILPSLISDTQRPTGTFGQYLYPTDAGLLEKTALAARTTADAFVPGVLGQAAGLGIGVLGNTLGLPKDTAQYLPLGYKGEPLWV